MDKVVLAPTSAAWYLTVVPRDGRFRLTRHNGPFPCLGLCSKNHSPGAALPGRQAGLGGQVLIKQATKATKSLGETQWLLFFHLLPTQGNWVKYCARRSFSSVQSLSRV